MGRCCNGLMIAFRALQLILSFVALGCGAFIVYQLVSLSGSANDMQTMLAEFVQNTSPDDEIEGTDFLEGENIHVAAQRIQKILKPLLEFLQGTPARAIVFTIASAWSVGVIIYLLVAQARAARHPKMNRRAVRISLEILTLLFWIVAVGCTALLAVQFGLLVFLGGTQTVIMSKVLKVVLKRQLQKADADPRVDQTLEFVEDLVTMGIVSLLAFISACICTFVSFVSSIAACCISGKVEQSQPTAAYAGYNAVETGYYGSPSTLASAMPPQAHEKNYTYSSVNEVASPYAQPQHQSYNSAYSKTYDNAQSNGYSQMHHAYGNSYGGGYNQSYGYGPRAL